MYHKQRKSNNEMPPPQLRAEVSMPPASQLTPGPAPAIHSNIPLSSALSQTVQNRSMDMFQAGTLVQTYMTSGIDPIESIKNFVSTLPLDINMNYSAELLKGIHFGAFQASTLISEMYRNYQMGKVVEMTKKKVSVDKISSISLDSIRFDASCLSKAHFIPDTSNPRFMSKHLINLQNVILTRSTRIVNKINDYVFNILLRLCHKPSDIQLFHYHILKTGRSVLTDDNSSTQLPSEVYEFVRDLVLDAVSLNDTVVSSCFPPTEDETKSLYFLNLGNCPKSRLDNLEIVRNQRTLLCEMTIPNAVSEQLRELKKADISVADNGVRCTRRSHSRAKPTKRPASPSPHHLHAPTPSPPAFFSQDGHYAVPSSSSATVIADDEQIEYTQL